MCYFILQVLYFFPPQTSHNCLTIFRGSSFVLSAVTTFTACLRRLFGMWLQCCLCVCACPMYLSVGCLVVHNQTSHRQAYQARTHIDNITATYQINDANKPRW